MYDGGKQSRLLSSLFCLRAFVVPLLLLMIAAPVSSFAPTQTTTTVGTAATTTNNNNNSKRCFLSVSTFSLSPLSPWSSSSLRSSNDPRNTGDSNEEGDPPSASFQEKLDSILDAQFFDPDQVLDNASGNNNENNNNDENSAPMKNSNPLAVWFANLVKNDYELAESLFAALFIAFMVIVSQELFRMNLYGENYVPFTKSVVPGSGRLF